MVWKLRGDIPVEYRQQSKRFSSLGYIAKTMNTNRIRSNSNTSMILGIDTGVVWLPSSLRIDRLVLGCTWMAVETDQCWLPNGTYRWGSWRSCSHLLVLSSRSRWLVIRKVVAGSLDDRCSPECPGAMRRLSQLRCEVFLLRGVLRDGVLQGV